MSHAALLERLQAWREAGWLRPLDLAFARFLSELDAAAPDGLLLAAALLANLEGRGHGCLPLAELARDPVGVLAWPPAAAPELALALAGWPADAAAARAAWADGHLLQADPADEAGASPLVLGGDRLYLRRYWRHESRVAAQVRARTTTEAAAVDVAKARGLLARLFAAAPADAAAEPDWQQVACALALRGRLTLITGGPGTGKTYTAARLLVLLQALHELHAAPRPLRVALAAPTGKAAARLRQAIATALQDLQRQLGDALPMQAWAERLGPARTLHSLLGARPGTRRFEHDAAHPLALDLLFVDEASMVHLEMMAALLDALPAGARVVLLGDKDQLASVEAGAVMGELCRPPARAGTGYRDDTAAWVQALTGQALPAAELGPGPDRAQQTVTLRRSRRFAGPIGRLALAVNRGDGAAALALLRDDPSGDLALVEAHDAGAITALAIDGRSGAGGAEGAAGGYRAYLETLAQRPADAADFEPWARHVLALFDRCRVLCAVREGPWGVAGVNAAIERALVEQRLLQRRGEWYAGRPVMVTRNDAGLGVFNGDIGVVLAAPAAAGQPERLRCWFADGEQLRSVSVARLAEVETAFALTVHKSQGSEFEHVLLVLPNDDSPGLTRELLYTGITRARRAVTLLAPKATLLAAASARLTRRFSGLGELLDR